MKAKLTCLLSLAVLLFAGCGGSRIGAYSKAAEETAATLGDFANYKEKGDGLKKAMLQSLVPLKKRIKMSEGLLNATGMATTASGAAATAMSQVLTDDASKKMIGAISSAATTVFGCVQILISKTDAAVDYAKVCNAAIQEWDIAATQDRYAYVKFLTKAEAIHDHYKKFATYTTDIDGTTTAKKVTNKEIVEFH
jgi:hypothetical protein